MYSEKTDPPGRRKQNSLLRMAVPEINSAGLSTSPAATSSSGPRGQLSRTEISGLHMSSLTPAPTGSNRPNSAMPNHWTVFTGRQSPLMGTIFWSGHQPRQTAPCSRQAWRIFMPDNRAGSGSIPQEQSYFCGPSGSRARTCDEITPGRKVLAASHRYFCLTIPWAGMSQIIFRYVHGHFDPNN